MADEQEAQEGNGEVPSVMSMTTRYLVGGGTVSTAAEDGSRIVQLVSGNNQTIIELNLSGPFCEFLAAKLTEVEVIGQDDEEEAPDAGHAED